MPVYQVIDSDDFNARLTDAGDKLVVVDFYATWCGPCKMIAPKFEAFSEEFKNVVFLKVDVDECDDLASDFEISCMPSFMFMKNSKKVTDFSGANVDKLKELIAEHQS